MRPPRRHVAIAGAGIGGLTLAIALANAGHCVTVLEQAERLGELGAGITVTAPAMAVFDAIGIWPRVRDITVRSTGMTFVHYRTREILHGEIDHEWTRRPDAVDQGGQTHRAMLHAVLVEELERIAPDAVRLGRRFESFAEDPCGVTVRCADGSEVDADLLVCADGIRSAGVKAVLGRENPASFSGVMAIRCLVPRALAEPFLGGGRSMKYVGPGRGFSRYGVRDGELINCIALARTDEWTAESWSDPCGKDEFLALYADFHRDVTGLIEAAPAGDIFKWALYDRDPLDRWSSARATLLGDAAHPMLPYLAQGATAAIEDALVLTRALDLHDDPAGVFAAYEAERIPRSSRQMLASREQGAALNQADPYAYAGMRPDLGSLLRYDPRRAVLS